MTERQQEEADVFDPKMNGKNKITTKSAMACAVVVTKEILKIAGSWKYSMIYIVYQPINF